MHYLILMEICHRNIETYESLMWEKMMSLYHTICEFELEQC